MSYVPTTRLGPRGITRPAIRAYSNPVGLGRSGNIRVGVIERHFGGRNRRRRDNIFHDMRERLTREMGRVPPQDELRESLRRVQP